MTKLYYSLRLQLFAEGGGDGGASAGGSTGAEGASAAGSASTTETDISRNMSPKAKKIYESMRKERNVDTEPQQQSQQTTEEERVPAPAVPERKLTYKELVESDDYKDDHLRYIQRTVKDRTKTMHKDLEEANNLLSIIGSKYGLDVNSSTFRADLEKSLKDDDSIYEKYAEEHDMPLAEAKRMVGLERQMAQTEQQAKERREAEEAERRIAELRQRAEETRKVYPNFDLDVEMQNEQFVRLTAALGGDTTMAYQALHHKDIVAQTVQKAAQTATQNVAESVRSNGMRPSESGISSSHTTNTKPDFASMSRKEFNAYAAELRRRSMR